MANQATVAVTVMRAWLVGVWVGGVACWPPVPPVAAPVSPVSPVFPQSSTPVALRPQPDWRDDVIYHLLTDRFRDGDASNNFRVKPGRLSQYQGGDWRGLRQRIEYLTTLGVTAVWVSPAMKNVEEHLGAAGYHGYWPQDFDAPNPHFGTWDEWRHTVRALRHAGIKVIADIVVNHVGQLGFYDLNGDGRPGPELAEWAPPFDRRGIQGPLRWLDWPQEHRTAPRPVELALPAAFHRRGEIMRWDDPDAVRLGDFPGGLKDLATESPMVRHTLIRTYARFLAREPVDGFRIDSVKHVEPGFFRVFCPALRQFATQVGVRGFFQFGEAFDGDPSIAAPYLDGRGLDAMLNWPFKARLDQILKFGAPTRELEELWRAEQRLFSDTARRYSVNFLDNHDAPRFLHGLGSKTERQSRLNLGLGLVFCAEGVPCVYYGTEQGFDGGADPANREPLARSEFATTGPYFELVRGWIALRKRLIALRRGETQIRWSTNRGGTAIDGGLFAFERVWGEHRVLVVANTTPEHVDPQPHRTAFEGHVMRTGFAEGTVLKDERDAGFAVVVGQEGLVEVMVPPSGIRVLVPR